MADFVIVAVLGGLIGFSELISRYRDAPARALRCRQAAVYVGINALASVAALGLLKAFKVDFGSDETKAWTIGILVAGLGAMAVFRTSLFTVRVANQDVAVGPSSLLTIILQSVDREVDRLRARARAESVTEVMKGVSFEKAYVGLPAFAFALMQNLSPEEQQEFARDLGNLKSLQMDEGTKSLILGLLLINKVGDQVVQDAVKVLSKEIVVVTQAPATSVQAPQPLPPAAQPGTPAAPSVLVIQPPAPAAQPLASQPSGPPTQTPKQPPLGS